jgi:hypothetical protein
MHLSFRAYKCLVAFIFGNDCNRSKFYSRGDPLTKAEEGVAVTLEVSKQEDKEKSAIFWDVTICSLIEVYRRFDGM